jgi:hypothetical protein
MDEFVYKITREQINRIAGRKLDDEQWKVMLSELQDLFDHYSGTEIPSLVDEIDVYVEEYREANS